MNTEFEHQVLVKLLNKRAENKRMDELNHRYTPVFWVIIGAIIVLLLVIR